LEINGTNRIMEIMSVKIATGLVIGAIDITMACCFLKHLK